MAIARDISYVNRDFDSLRSRLINFSQTYFPNTYTDFDPSSPGIMFIEQAAYVGDVLSFYVDNQVQETYVQYARQNSNLFDLAYMFGYKPKLTGLATTDIDFFQLVPSKNVDGKFTPDYDYALLFPGGLTTTSDTGATFITEDPIDFTVSSSSDPTTVSVAQIAGNQPTYYLLKKTRAGRSGFFKTKVFTLGDYEEFPTVELNESALAEIISVTDGNGNLYYEVDYLGQELVFNSIKNTQQNQPNNYTDENDAPYILQTVQTPYRFTVRHLNSSRTQIQFGAGSPDDIVEERIPNTDNVGLGLPFKKDKLTTAFSPLNFLKTDTYGVAPSNTTITVRYSVGGGVGSNIAANTLTRLDTSNIKFQKQNLVSSTADFVFSSIACNNPISATGGSGGDTIEQIRQNTLAEHSSQLRNVTADDYLVRALSMPAQYGQIAKAVIQKPKVGESSSTLCLYVLGFDKNKKLTTTSRTLKQNLKTYLNEYRMIGDSIDIKDAFIINLAIDFEITTQSETNNNAVIRNCIQSLQVFFDTNRMQINQPISLITLEQILDNQPGVQTVKKLIVSNKTGVEAGYSEYAYDIPGATQDKVIYPSIDPMVFEIKYPTVDIKGRVVTP